MKKTKHILLAVTSAVMAMVVAFAVGCDCKKNPSPDPGDEAKTLQSIELDTSNAKTIFIANRDDYSSEGLVIKATYLTKETQKTVTEDITTSTSGVSIDSSAFKKNAEGTYSITVFYTYERVLRYSAYDVTVINARAGLDVRLKSGVDSVVGVGEDGKADLSGVADWIEVRKPDALGVIDENSAPLAASEYTVSVYRNDTKIDDLSSVSSGTYQIWASVDYPDVEGYTLEGFVLIYIDDKPVSLELAANAVTTQTVSMTDNLTPNWQFVITLSSGQTETITAASAGVTVTGVDTTVIAENKQATVVYAPGGNAGRLTTTVNYTITAPAEGEGVTLNRSFKYTDLTSAIRDIEGADGATDNLPLKPEYFTGDNAFIAMTAGDGNIYRTSNNCFQIKGDAVTLLVQGSGTISVSFASTGSSNASRLALKDVDGNYITASNTSATAVVAPDSEAGSYAVTGTTATEVVWSGLEAGTYTLCSPAGVTGRGCRITAVGLTDLIGDVEPPFDPSTNGALHTSSFSYAELGKQIAAVEGAELSTLGTSGDKIPLKPEYFTNADSTNSFIKLIVTGNAGNQYRSSNSCFEIQNDAITVDFTGVGYLEVTFASTGGSNTSRCGVKNSDGDYLVAVSNGSATLVTAPADGEDNSAVGAYQVTGTGFVTLKYEIKVAGTYTICAPYTTATPRGARIQKLVLSDYYN